MRLFLILVLFNCSCFAQIKQIGMVKNSEEETIGSVVITIFKTGSPEFLEKITITDEQGKFELDLETGINYTLQTKHLSFKDHTITFSPSSQLLMVLLEPGTQALSEIIINHEKPKVTIKQDTISFNLAKYIDPNDRKLKDLVEKLPGLTLQEDGTIYFKGEKVTEILVENEEFFGGGTKLGLDNIPANALEKLEIISNYSKSNILKDSRRSNEQVINLVLKKDRNSILFGSADAATNFDEFYKLHAALFQFKRKKQNNVILDGNDIAEQSIGNNESEALANINSELFNLIEVPIRYNTDDKEFSKIDTKLIAANFKRIGNNSTWDFLTYYNNLKDAREITENQNYFDNSSYENKLLLENRALSSLYFRTTNYLQNTKKERLFAFVISSNESQQDESIQSNSNLGQRVFNNDSNEKNIFVTTVLEETRRINEKSNIVYGAKIDLLKNDTEFSLISSDSFIDELIPWVNQEDFILEDILSRKIFNTEIGGVYQYSFKKNRTFSISPKLTHSNSSLEDVQYQLLDNNIKNNFGNLFNSTSDRSNTQIDIKTSYRQRKSSYDFTFGIRMQAFDLIFKSSSSNSGFSEILIDPFANFIYFLNEKKQFSVEYYKSLKLPNIEQLSSYSKIRNYTSVVSGNSNLEEESSHYFSMNYSDYNIPENYSFTSYGSLEIKEKSIATLYTFNDINRATTYFIQENAGYSFRLRNSFFYLFKQFSIGIGLNFSKIEQKVLLSTFQNSESNRINVTPKFQTNFKKAPNLSFSPFWSYNSQKLGFNSDNYVSIGFKSKSDFNITKQLYIISTYDFFQIDGVKTFDTLDFELRYSNKIKSIDLSIIGKNVLSSNMNSNIFQTIIFSSENNFKTLGNRFLLKLNYNF